MNLTAQTLRPEGPTLFSEAAENWLRARQTELKSSSIVKYRNILNRHLLPRFGALPLDRIRREELLACGRELLSAGLSPRSAGSILAVMRSILCFAQRSGFAAEDPGPVTFRPKQEPLRVFSRSEQKRLTAYLLARGDLAARGALLSLYTGLRIGELCALTWGDISVEDRCIHVRHTMQRLQTLGPGPKTTVQITAPKSQSSQRTIPLPDWMMAELLRLRRPDSCYFLTGSEKYMEPRTMENRFRSALDACGIRGASFHTCRHSFATRCIELGFDVKTLSEILGHATVNITMNRYVHPSLEFKRESMNRLAALIPENE